MTSAVRPRQDRQIGQVDSDAADADQAGIQDAVDAGSNRPQRRERQRLRAGAADGPDRQCKAEREVDEPARHAADKEEIEQASQTAAIW